VVPTNTGALSDGTLSEMNMTRGPVLEWNQAQKVLRSLSQWRYLIQVAWDREKTQY